MCVCVVLCVCVCVFVKQFFRSGGDASRHTDASPSLFHCGRNKEWRGMEGGQGTHVQYADYMMWGIILNDLYINNQICAYF